MSDIIDLSPYRPEIITLDGTAAAGKGTIAKGLIGLLSRHNIGENIRIMDAGSSYRLMTYFFQERKMSPQYLDSMPEDELSEFLLVNIGINYDGKRFILNNEDIADPLIRTKEINEIIADYADIPSIKNYAVGIQKRTLKMYPNMWWILDGRCMGTAVAENAMAKIYVDGDVSMRAIWRKKQYADKYKDLSPEEVKAELILRDKKDKETATHPLRVPHGSYNIVSTEGTEESNPLLVYEFFMDRMKRLGKLKEN